MKRSTKRKIGTGLFYAGLGGSFLLFLRRLAAERKAAKMIAAGAKNPESIKWDIDPEKYSVNKVEDGKVPVFTDADAAIESIYDETDPRKKELLKKVILRKIRNPQFDFKPKRAIYIDKRLLGTKVFAHELGHAEDKDLKVMDRLPFMPTNLIKGLISPDSTGLVKSEARAWDNAKVPEGDPLREAALDTYRGAQRSLSYSLPLLAMSGVGAYMKFKNR